MEIRLIPLALATALALGLTACSTVDSRIRRDPATWSALSGQDRELVRSQRIREGLPAAAVLIAWGRPDIVESGRERGKTYETWIWLAYYDQPVGVAPLWAPSPYWAAYPYYAPIHVTRAVPVREAIFENGKVVAWRARHPY